MHTASSANRTCRARASTSECTATVFTSSSRQALRTRSAISPRFAIRIFLNIAPSVGRTPAGHAFAHPMCRARWALRLLDPKELLTVFHALAVLREHFGHGARAFGLDLVHQLHRFDDAERLPRADHRPHLHERRRVGVVSRRRRAGARPRRRTRLDERLAGSHCGGGYVCALCSARHAQPDPAFFVLELGDVLRGKEIEERAQLVEIEAHANGRTLCPKRPRWEAVHAPPRTLPHGLPHAPRGAGNRLRMRTAAREHSHEPFECEFVAIAAEARDAADARLGD